MKRTSSSLPSTKRLVASLTKWSAALLACSVASTAVAPACVDSTPLPSPIVIGCLYRDSRENAALACDVVEAQINALGGIRGRPLNFVKREVPSTEAPGIGYGTLRDALAGQGARIIVGPSASSSVTSLVESGQLVADNILLATPSATRARLPVGEANHVLRTVVDDSHQARALASLLRTGLSVSTGDAGATLYGGGCTSVTVLHADDTYGAELAADLKAELGTMATLYSFPANQQPIALPSGAQIARCVVVVHTDDRSGAALVRLAQTAAPGARFFGSDGLDTADFAGKIRSDGIGMLFVAPDPDPGYLPGRVRTKDETTELARVSLPFIDARNSDAPFHPYFSQTYDAALLAALTIAQAGPDADYPTVWATYVGLAGAVGEERISLIGIGPALARANAGRLDPATVDYVGTSGSVDIEGGNVLNGAYVVHRLIASGASDATFERVGYLSQ